MACWGCIRPVYLDQRGQAVHPQRHNAVHTRRLALASHLIAVFGYVNNNLCRWLGFQEQVLAPSCSLGLGTVMLGSPHLSLAPLKPQHLGGCLQLPTRKKSNVSMWSWIARGMKGGCPFLPSRPCLSHGPNSWLLLGRKAQGEWPWILSLDPQCPLEVRHSRSPRAALMHQPSQYQGFPPKVIRLGI